jgi:hypothetical protein
MAEHKEPKNRWSLRYLSLAGMTAGVWWRLLREVEFDVDAVYAHRAAYVSFLSVINSANAWVERQRFGKAVQGTPLEQAPLFILGHWRSGTTHLHNLLAQDIDRFAFPNTFQVVNPETFLTTERTGTRLFRRWVPERRPMDNMEMGFHLPQEDEFAPFLTTLYSSYVGIHFPRWMKEYERYLTFEGAPRCEVEEWGRALMWFLKKVTYRCGGRALLLKSPPHTARIRWLLELFPGARFVHIHRDPYEVFQSTCHYFDTAPWLSYLQVPDGEAEEGVLRRYATLYDAFFRQVDLIPAGQFHQMRFEDLERDPIGELRRLYGALGLAGFESVQPCLERYVGSLAGYRRNRFSSLPADARARVRKAWQRSFQAWGYPG